MLLNNALQCKTFKRTTKGVFLAAIVNNLNLRSAFQW
jgi:hypothetical protein